MAVVFALSDDNRIVGSIILTAKESDEAGRKSDTLEVPSDATSLLVACVAGGTSGQARFENPVLESAENAPATDVPSAPEGSNSNFVRNGDFRGGADPVPEGWSLDEDLAPRGSMKVEDGDAGRRLRLTPNGKNNDREKLFAVGQLVDVRAVKGKTLRFSAGVEARGEATATAIVFALKNEDVLASAIITHPPGDRMVKSETLGVPEDATMVLVGCAVSGTEGDAWFDNVSLAEVEASAEGVQADPGTARIVIDTAAVVRTIPETVFGTTLDWTYNANFAWDPARGAFKPEILAPAEDWGVGVVRFPGGTNADYYHWKDGVGPQSSRPMRDHVIDPGERSRSTVGTDEFVSFCRRIGAEPLLTVNMITGTPEEAAEWVAYCNQPSNAARRANGVAEPHNVKLWEIGNEQYLIDDNPDTARSILSAEEYAARYLKFARAMRQVDPTIKICAVGGTNFGRYKIVHDDRWNKKVLEAAAGEMDCLAVHNGYAPILATGDGGVGFYDVYQTFMGFPQMTADNLKTLGRQIQQFAPAHADRIKIAVTEWGPLFHYDPKSRWVGHTKTLGSALFVGSMLHVFLRDPRVEITTSYKLTDPTFMGWIDWKGNPKPSYLAMQMYTRHFGRELLTTRVTSTGFDTSPLGLVDGRTGVPFLDAVASFGNSRRDLFLIVINRHFTKPVRTDVRVTGFKPTARGQGWVLTGASIDANNGEDLQPIPGFSWGTQITAPDNSKFQGRPGDVAIREFDAGALTESFSYEFPPLSITALKLSRGSVP
jgi:alpha-N-arabinofuranosidase